MFVFPANNSLCFLTISLRILLLKIRNHKGKVFVDSMRLFNVGGEFDTQPRGRMLWFSEEQLPSYLTWAFCHVRGSKVWNVSSAFWEWKIKASFLSDTFSVRSILRCFFFWYLTREKREGVKRFQSNLSAIHDELIPKSHYAIAINRRLASSLFPTRECLLHFTGSYLDWNEKSSHFNSRQNRKKRFRRFSVEART